MALAYLLDPTKQYQNRAGVNNVSGWLEVFRMDTDTRATVYSDFAGTVAPARIGIDNNGRAVMIVESGIAYRVEMYSPDGDLLFTQQPIYTQASGGGIGSLTRVESTDGSVGVESSTVGSVVTYDLSVADDGSDLLEWVRCDGAEKVTGTDVYRPTYTDGTLYIGDRGIELGEDCYYHVTAHIRATKNTQREPFYDKIYIGLQTNDGTNTTQITRKSEIIDYSLGLTQEFEFSTDVYAQADCELELVINGSEVAGGDIEVVDVEAHRIFSGSPAIPSGVLSRARAAETYQRKLIAGQNITITETEEGDVISSTGGGGGGGGATYQSGEGIVVNNTTYRISIDDSVVQEKLTAGDNITITNNVISATVPSVDISGKADKVSDAVSGNLAGLDATGNLTDSGLAADRVVTDPSYVHTDNNFTTELKNKLINIEAGAQANVQADWNETDSSADSYIQNKPDMSVYATQSDLSGLQPMLTAGSNITIDTSTWTISAAGGGSSVTVDQTYDPTSTNAQSGTAVAQAVSGVNAVPASTSSDENKVLTVDSNGDPVWANAQGGGIEVFYITSTTTNDEIYQAFKAGKFLYYQPYTDAMWIPMTMHASYSSGGYRSYPIEGSYATLPNTTYSSAIFRVYQAEIMVDLSTDHANSNAFNPTSKSLYAINTPLVNSSNAGKVLTAKDATDGVVWSSPTDIAPVQDVTVDGTSVVSNNTAAFASLPLIAGTGITLTETAQGLVISLT